MRQLFYDNKDIDTVERPERSTSKNRDSLLDEPCINIYRKDNVSAERGRGGRTSSNKSKRHLSSSHSKSSPVRFGSSESRRKQNIRPQKVLNTRVIPLNEPKPINQVPRVAALRRREPVVQTDLLGVRRADKPIRPDSGQAPFYQSIDPDDTEEKRQSETTQEFITIDPPERPGRLLHPTHHSIELPAQPPSRHTSHYSTQQNNENRD